MLGLVATTPSCSVAGMATFGLLPYSGWAHCQTRIENRDTRLSQVKIHMIPGSSVQQCRARTKSYLLAKNLPNRHCVIDGEGTTSSAVGGEVGSPFWVMHAFDVSKVWTER